jgi:Holliday junction resolvase RusA-like endonuclease
MNSSYSWKTVGVPAPQGSKRYVGNGRMIESSKALKPWRELIIADAKQQGVPAPIDRPVGVALVFCFPRPKAHFTTNGQIKANAPKYKTTRPDLDKCVRAVLRQPDLRRRHQRRQLRVQPVCVQTFLQSERRSRRPHHRDGYRHLAIQIGADLA